MRIQVTGLDFNFDEGHENDMTGVNVRFNSHDPNGEIYINGYVKLSKEEYDENPSTSKLLELIKTKIIERVSA